MPIARRPIGQRVRVSDGGRYHGTRGTIRDHVQAFGTVLYRVAAETYLEYGQSVAAPAGWTCLCFPGDVRTLAAADSHPAQRTEGGA